MTTSIPPEAADVEKVALLPCPFCGGLKLRKVVDDGLAWTLCESCGATGPETTRYDDEEAHDWQSRAPLSPPAEAGWKPTHRHVKRGTEYQRMEEADLQTETPLSDYAVLTLYREKNGRMWARPTSEFNDGRFEALSALSGGAK